MYSANLFIRTWDNCSYWDCHHYAYPTNSKCDQSKQRGDPELSFNNRNYKVEEKHYSE